MRKAIVFFFLLFLPLFANAEGTNGLVVLLNDYGNQDFYVGALKGAIYTKFPQARIDTITNEVPQFNVREGAYILAHAAVEFPAGTVFCVVVDPGVGTRRRPIAVETEDGKYYVAPDNGVLTFVLLQSKAKEIREIKNPLFMRDANSLSSTFHGRDIFGPASAVLAKGVPIQLAGPPVNDPVLFKVADPTANGEGVSGQVEHVDWYGNIHTNLSREVLVKAGISEGKTLHFRIGSESLEAPFVKTYADVRQGDWLALINSAGVLEIARNQASANAILQIAAGSRVTVKL